MPRMVKCVKLGKELPGLEFKPFNNELGQRIYDSVSQEAWKMWLEHFKMIMNEYRLGRVGAGQPGPLRSMREVFLRRGRAATARLQASSSKRMILLVSCYEL